MHVQNTFTEFLFFKGSAQFVEFFFILSGFVLTHSYGKYKVVSFKTFVFRRFARLYPLHLVMLFVVTFIEVGKYVAWNSYGFAFSEIPFTGRFEPSEFIPNLLLLQSWTSVTNPLSFNFVSWSISIEFYLYIIFYLIICLFLSNKFIIFLSIFILGLLLRVTESTILVQEVVRGLTCFFGGGITYLVFIRYRKNISLSRNNWTIIESFTLLLVVSTVSSRFPYRDVVLTFLYFWTIFVFAYEAGYFSKILSKKLFRRLGDYSYSIYMIHPSILFVLTSILMLANRKTELDLVPIVDGRRFLDIGGIIPNNLMVILTLILTVTISHFTFKYIEIKFANKLKDLGHTT